MKKIIKKEETTLVTKKNAGAEIVARINNKEDMVTAVYRSAHQFNLLTQSILKQKFNFEDRDLVELNKEITKAVEGLAYFEEKGLHPLSGHSLDQLVDVTVRHWDVLKAARSGLELPVNKKAAKLLMEEKK